MTISRVKFPWPPFFRIFIFFDEVFNTVCGTTYLVWPVWDGIRQNRRNKSGLA